jgi:hypothetical protein
MFTEARARKYLLRTSLYKPCTTTGGDFSPCLVATRSNVPHKPRVENESPVAFIRYCSLPHALIAIPILWKIAYLASHADMKITY